MLLMQQEGRCPKPDTDVTDCKESFEMALTAMKRVTEMVNEGEYYTCYSSIQIY